MLYDILPPLIFFFSLGGIIFMMTRVTLRVRRADLESSISAVAAAGPTPSVLAPRKSLAPVEAEMADLLRPSQKGVKVITSRMSGVLASVQAAGQGLRDKTKQLPAAWRARREAKADISTEAKTPAVTESTGVVLPTISPRRRTAEKLVGQVRSVANQLQEKSHQQLQALKKVAQKRRSDPVEGIKTMTPARAESVMPAPALTVKRRRSLAQPTNAPVANSFRATGMIRRQAPAIGSTALGEVRHLISEQNYELAEEMLLPHIVKHPKDTTAYLLLGEVALAREAWDEAEEIYEQVLRINPKTKGVYAGLGLSAYRLGNFTKALQMLQRALNEDATNRAVLEAVLSLAQKLDNKGLQHSIEEQLQELDQPVTDRVQV